MVFDYRDDLYLQLLTPAEVLGADEAGRGPLAGPVYAAAVILPESFPCDCLDDSKKLSEKQRNEAEIIIKERATAWAVAFATHVEIDRINILKASMLAMKRAILKLPRDSYSSILIDGNKVPDVAELSVPVYPVIKGDARIPQIMAASILAKNARDRFMDFCDSRWPGYGYARHKGYPTGNHMEAIRALGPSPIQRLSFSCRNTPLSKEKK